MSGEAGLTHGEAQLYDRQLRLWGVDAQRRLKSSRIVMFGVSALVGEVGKNLILAGVNRVTLVDKNVVTEQDLASSFFVSESDLGKNKAAAFCGNLRVLNSLVRVDSFEWQPSPVGESASLDDFFEKNADAQPSICERDFVIVSGFNLATSAAIVGECRKAGAACYVAGVSGALGCFFADLGDSFKYCQSDDAQLSNFQRSNVGAEQTATFPPLSTVLALNPSLKRTDLVSADTPSGQRYFSLACNFLNTIADGKNLSTIDKSLLEFCGENVEIICDDGLTPATSSIVGGILAQEIVKGICRNAAPFNNFFFLDATRFFSLVDCIKSASPASSDTATSALSASAMVGIPVSVSP